MKKSSLFFVFLSLAISFQSQYAFADWSDISSDEFEMAPPPKKGSAAYQRDFKLLLQYQEQNRDEECELASTQLAPTYESFFKDSPLSNSEYKKANDLVSRVMKYTEKVAGVFKEEYMRPRPFNTDPRVQPCIKKPGGSKAYPSSHAANASAAGCVLAKIFPSKADELRSYAKHLGDLRVIVGVHHPSDVEAGQKLGLDVCRALLGNSDFKQELSDLE